jgi:hypothetical protein
MDFTLLKAEITNCSASPLTSLEKFIGKERGGDGEKREKGEKEKKEDRERRKRGLSLSPCLPG